MDVNDVKYLKEVQEKINATAQQLSKYMESIQKVSDDGHTTNEDALMDLATYIAMLEVRVSELEERING